MVCTICGRTSPDQGWRLVHTEVDDGKPVCEDCVNEGWEANQMPVTSFPVYQAVEWQCRHVDPETKLCCIRELNHDGDHRFAELEYGQP